MSIILSKDAVLIKVFNNNIILVKIEGKEKILFAKGIGFGKKFGDIIKKDEKVEKVFSIEDEENVKNLDKLIDKVDHGFFAICEEAIYEISDMIDGELNENIHIGLIDHLHFAIKRLKTNEEIQNPFVVEIETLYPKAFALAKMVAKKVGDYVGQTNIPEGEVGFIALHIHSAINKGKLSNTIKYSYLSSTIVEYVEDELGMEIDRKSLDYARFLTHIRFAIERITSNELISNDLASIIKKKYKKSYKIAKEVGKIIGKELIVEVSEDEISYLAMHIERFRVSIDC